MYWVPPETLDRFQGGTRRGENVFPSHGLYTMLVKTKGVNVFYHLKL